VRGSDGTAFHPFVSVHDRLPVFYSTMFRAVDFVYDATLSFKDIKVYHFTMAPDEWQNSIENPKNAVYYQNGPSGLFNITSMGAGIPLFLSKPRFKNCAQSLRDAILPIYKDCNDYDTEFFIEPRSGFAVHSAARTQSTSSSIH